jgi:hypothetical protein
MKNEKSVPSAQVAHRKEAIPTEFFDEKQAASYLNMSVQWLRKCRANGSGPCWMKFEHAIRYPIKDLEAYAEISCRRFTGEIRQHVQGPPS